MFGPFNTLMCRPGAIFSYRPNIGNAKRKVIAFDIKIFSPVTTKQNLFSTRNNNNNYVSLTAYLDPADRLIKIALQNPNWNVVLVSPVPINLGIDTYLKPEPNI